MLNTIRSWLRLRADRLATWQARRFFAGLDREARYRMAQDAGLSVYELEMVIGNSVRAERLLGETLTALGVTRQAVARRHPSALRDISSACARCGSALNCGREILNGTVPENLDLYCANAPDLRRITARRGAAEGPW